MALPPVLTAVYRNVVPLSSLVEPWAPGAALGHLGWCACVGPATAAEALAATLKSSLPPAHVAATGTAAAVVQAAIAHILTVHPAPESWQKSGNVLARGFRLGPAPQTATAAPSGGSATSVAAATVHQRHDNPAVDFFVSSAWCDVVAAVQSGGFVTGARWLWALLTSTDIAVFVNEARGSGGGGLHAAAAAEGDAALASNLRQASRAATSPPPPHLLPSPPPLLVRPGVWMGHGRAGAADADADAPRRWCRGSHERQRGRWR
jgi:hypothetical protein